MADESGVEIIGTEKVREVDGSPVITLPQDGLDKSDLASNEYAVVATNGQALFLVPSTAESIHDAIEGDEDPTGVDREITERRERERELEETTKRMELALQGSESWLWEWNLQTETITQSAVTGILGIDEDDVTRSVESFLQEIHPADREGFLAGREEAVDGDGNYHNEFRLRQGGDVRWIESRGQVYPDDSGAPERLIGIATDVTDRKKRERELTETTQRLEAIIDASPNAIIVSDTDGVVEQWNPAAERMFGWDAEEVIGEEIPIIPDDKEVEFETHRERMRDGELIEATDTQRLTADGERIDVRVSAAPVRDADGQITGAMAIFEDITDRKQRERELEEATERMRLALQGSESWIWEVDLETDVVTQEAVTDLLGVEGDRVTRPIEEFIDDVHPDDRDMIVTNQPRVRGGEPYHAEYRLLQDGEVRWIESRGLPYPQAADDPDRIIGIATDITDRKERDRELQRQIDRLDKFASVVSHDLLNPLNVAMGRLDLARQECESPHLDHVERSLDRMAALIDDLLTLARAGETVSDMEAVSLAEVTDTSWHTVATREATLVTETDRTIKADESRLQQLLENLIGNAVEHGGDDVTVTVGDLDDGTGFFVADDGPGIPAEEREEIFEYGYSTTQEGTGLGLNIVREIVEAHGWAISVTDSETGGARFEITGVVPADG